MIIYINSIYAKDTVKIGLMQGDCFVVEKVFEAKYAQAEKLLPIINEMLDENKLFASELEKIIVQDEGEGFSALRVGVITANALGFAFNVPVESTSGASIQQKNFSIIAPIYNKEPNINLKCAVDK